MRNPQSPLPIFLIIALTAFVGEALVMLLLHYYQPTASWQGMAIADATLLCLMISPVLYFFLFRPMVLLIADVQRSERQFKTLANGMFEGMAITAQDRILDVNEQLTRMMGYERDELIGQSVLSFIPAEDRDWVTANIQAGLENHIEREVFRKDGSRIVVEARGRTIEQQDFPIRLIAIRDMTERKRAEESLRKNAERIQAQIENSPMAFISWDHDFKVTQWAGEAARMFGWSEAEVLGKQIMDLHVISEEDLPRFRESMAKLTAGARYITAASRNVTKDGRVIHCEWYKSVLSSGDGTVASVMAQVLDVTERKRMEQEMLAMNNQLTHEVAMRTADLSALTAHIQKIAENERASLASELHDELGSSLAVISMEVGRLRGKISDPDLLQGLSQIKNLVSKAVQTTRAVVNQLYPTILDKSGLVAAIEWQVNEFRKHSGITVELAVSDEQIDAEHAFALAAYRITQECLTNVAKHAGADKIHIEVKTHDGFLELTIHDNGKGLPAEVNNGGHGIFGMVERARYLGGSLEIGSEAGMGTTAHLRLPLEAAKPKDRMKVLVVDDHAIVRDALRQILDTQTDDFAVAGEAADGKTAAQMAIAEDWDIVLLDINLPKKNGIRVLEEVVAVKPDLPIIMLSTHAEEEYGETALAKGAACYIEKGETEKLVGAMRRAILLEQPV